MPIHAHCIDDVDRPGSQSQIQTFKSWLRAAAAWWRKLLLSLLECYMPSTPCIVSSLTARAGTGDALGGISLQ